MLPRTYENENCSLARTLELVGERWTLLIVRDVFRGLRRFEQLQANLGIARNVLTSRLDRLVEAGILERVRYQEGPERFEYHPTDKGGELGVPLLALLHWGDRHLAPAGPPVLTEHAGCGGEIVERHVCSKCGAEPANGEIETRAGPGDRATARAFS